MVDTMELRRGNYIVVESQIEPVIDVLCDSVSTHTKNCMPLEFCDPIILTPEILEKCGFEKYDKGNVEFYDIYKTKNGLFIIMAKNDIPFGYNDKAGRWYMDDNHTEIPSLHWLQNYVYFNHKVELIINL